MSNSKSYVVYENFSMDNLGESLKNYLSFSKNLNTQSFKTEQGGVFIQARESSSLKKLIGMGKAIQVELVMKENRLFVNIGQGDWLIEKAGTALIGQLIFAPLILTSILGGLIQVGFPNEVLDFVDRYMSSGGKSTI